MTSRTVLLTDRAWPDDRIERSIIEGAGLQLATGGPAPGTPAEVERLVVEHDPAAIMTCWAPVSAAAIIAGLALRVVTRLGVGLDNIAVSSASDRGVLVTNVPDYCVEEVSDHAVALVLTWARGIVRADRAVHDGEWSPAAATPRRLSSLTCGIVGLGRIGRLTATKLAALGVRVIASTPHPPVGPGPVTVVPLPELMAASDVVIVHAPLNDSTYHLVGRNELDLMRPGGLLVNVSRGGLVDNDALVEALGSGQLSGAGLDVVEGEPAVPAALLDHPGVVITPHIAFSSDASVAELRRRATEDVVRVLSGRPARHVCNRDRNTEVGAVL